MTRLAFRSLASRPLRTVLTVLAILLGVAMITGTYVLTDQIDNGFANIFQTSYKGTAVQVAPKTSFGSNDSGLCSINVYGRMSSSALIMKPPSVYMSV